MELQNGRRRVAWMQDGRRTDVYVRTVRFNTDALDRSLSALGKMAIGRRHCATPLELYNEDDESPITMFVGVC